MIVSEWWEVWICVPGRDPVRREDYGNPFDFRIPSVGFPTREGALRAAEGNIYSKVVHVVRRKRK